MSFRQQVKQGTGSSESLRIGHSRPGFGRSNLNADLLNVDRDADGVFNSWELEQFDSLAIDLTVDTDFDHSPDVIELILGTNPGDARSVFVAAVTAASAGDLVITAEAHPRDSYYLEWSETMAPGSWTGVSGGQRVMVYGTIEFSVTHASGATQGFYRIRAVPDVMPLIAF